MYWDLTGNSGLLSPPAEHDVARSSEIEILSGRTQCASPCLFTNLVISIAICTVQLTQQRAERNRELKNCTVPSPSPQKILLQHLVKGDDILPGGRKGVWCGRM